MFFSMTILQSWTGLAVAYVNPRPAPTEYNINGKTKTNDTIRMKESKSREKDTQVSFKCR